MNKIFKLLEDKNYWYKKYLNCNEAFLIAIKHAPEIAVDEIELFYGNRESLLKIIEDIDQKLQIELTTLEIDSGEKLNSDSKTKIQYYLREKDSILVRIIQLDDEIIRELDTLKEFGLEKIKNLSKGKKALANYKSTKKYNDKLDKRV